MKSRNYYLDLSDPVRKSLLILIDDKKQERIRERARTINLNRDLRKQGDKLLPLEPLYTVKELASVLCCNYSTLRKALNGYGRLPIDVVDRISEMTNTEVAVITVKYNVPAEKIKPCRVCGSDMIMWTWNKKYCSPKCKRKAR